MAITVEKTRITRGNQTVVPSKVRQKFGLKPGDEVIWAVLRGEVHLKFIRKKERGLTDLIGKIDMGPSSSMDIDEVVSRNQS